ncbi:MAG TPA: hypothetical protein VN823_05995 [Stellaceae bacterium]|nr:hypothetical protein [Stellaceae bacterium]
MWPFDDPNQPDPNDPTGGTGVAAWSPAITAAYQRDPRIALAQSLMEQGQQRGYTTPILGLARALQEGIGGFANARLMGQYGALNKNTNAALAAALKGSQGQPVTNPDGTVSQPQFDAAAYARALAGSNNPILVQQAHDAFMQVPAYRAASTNADLGDMTVQGYRRAQARLLGAPPTTSGAVAASMPAPASSAPIVVPAPANAPAPGGVAPVTTTDPTGAPPSSAAPAPVPSTSAPPTPSPSIVTQALPPLPASGAAAVSAPGPTTGQTFPRPPIFPPPSAATSATAATPKRETAPAPASPTTGPTPVFDIPSLVDQYKTYATTPGMDKQAAGVLSLIEKATPEGGQIMTDGSIAMRPGYDKLQFAKAMAAGKFQQAPNGTWYQDPAVAAGAGATAGAEAAAKLPYTLTTARPGGVVLQGGRPIFQNPTAISGVTPSGAPTTQFVTPAMSGTPNVPTPTGQPSPSGLTGPRPGNLPAASGAANNAALPPNTYVTGLDPLTKASMEKRGGELEDYGSKLQTSASDAVNGQFLIDQMRRESGNGAGWVPGRFAD